MNEGDAHVYDIPALRFLSAANRDALNGFQKFRSVMMDKGALSSNEKLLIALACTVMLKSESCIKIHTKEALKSGIKKEEILEAAIVAGLICGGSGFAFASMVMEVEE